MARPPKGKPLTLRPIRLDDDVWAECQRLGKEFGTINEGLRAGLFGGGARRLNEAVYGDGGATDYMGPVELAEKRKLKAMVEEIGKKPEPLTKRLPVENWKRGPRQKGDKSR